MSQLVHCPERNARAPTSHSQEHRPAPGPHSCSTLAGSAPARLLLRSAADRLEQLADTVAQCPDSDGFELLELRERALG